MAGEGDEIGFVYGWVARKFPSYSEEEFEQLDPPSRRVVALVQVQGQQMNGRFPAVYYNGYGYMMPDAIACLQKIGAEKLASIAQAYVDAVTANPYLGPPEIWPTPEASAGSQSPEEVKRVEALDDAFWAAEYEFGIDRFWESLAAEVRLIDARR